MNSKTIKTLLLSKELAACTVLFIVMNSFGHAGKSIFKELSLGIVLLPAVLLFGFGLKRGQLREFLKLIENYALLAGLGFCGLGIFLFSKSALNTADSRQGLALALSVPALSLLLAATLSIWTNSAERKNWYHFAPFLVLTGGLIWVLALIQGFGHFSEPERFSNTILKGSLLLVVFLAAALFSSRPAPQKSQS